MEEHENEPLKVIHQVTTQFDIPLDNFKTLRAIGTTLCKYGNQCDDQEREKAIITEGVSYLKQAVERMEGDAQEKIATLRILAPWYTWLGQHTEAIKYHDQAYALLPDPESEDLTKEKQKEFSEIRLDLLIVKAQAYLEMEQPEEALKIWNEARKFSGDEPLLGTHLDDITLLFKDKNDPDGTKLMHELKSWTEKERNSWFTYCYKGWIDRNAEARMQKAAKRAGETELLLEWLHALAKTLPEDSYFLFNVRSAIANLYHPVMGNVQKGKALRQEILAMNPKPDWWEEETMQEQKTQQRLKLAEILFNEFQDSADPTKKEEMFETLKLLPNPHGGDDHFRESHVNMLLANMLRIMGPAKDFQKHMNDLFAACVAGLEDSVSWNDSSSLRLLSKVLASLDGLERDAKIACAAQFSILDRSIYDQSSGTEGSETASDKDSTEADVKATDETETETETSRENDEDEKAPLADGESKAADATPSNKVTSQRRDSAEVAEAPASVATVPQSTAGEPDSSKAQPELSSTVPESNEEQQRPAEEQSETTSEKPEELDEDVTGSGIYCDGGCGTDISRWTQPMYYCLVCVNCDLCEECYGKRLAQTRGEIEEPWLSFCGPDHRYIKAPMKGWKGIKNGVIRIEGEEEFTVEDWLKGLKEERWQKAWDTFWTRQGGLKDIGLDD